MANTKLTRTFSSTGNRKIFTTSFWMKRSKLGGQQPLFSTDLDNTNNNYTMFYLDGGDGIGFFNTDGGVSNVDYLTNRKLRDTNAWYHIVIVFDSTQSGGNRIKFYINGVRETSFANSTEPNQDADNTWFNRTYEHMIGTRSYDSSTYFDGSMSHFHFIDGTAYDASAFGETDSTTGEWKIKTSPSVTYGNNGFFILKDGNSVTDQSSNTNNFSIGVGAGGGLSKTEDSPSNVFATLNPLDTADATDFSSLLQNGNTTLTGSANDKGLRGTLGASSGKFYWEIKANDEGDTLCVARSDVRLQINNTSGTPSTGFWGVQSNGTGASINTYENGTFVSSNALQGYASNTIIGIALDMDNGKIYYSFNGVFKGRDNNSSDPANQTNPFFSSLPTDGTFIMPFTENRSSGGSTYYNFGNGYFANNLVASAGTNASGNGIFEYDVPTGYTALSTKGLNL